MNYRPLVILFAIALIARLLVFSFLISHFNVDPGLFWADSSQYTNLGKNLADNGVFSMSDHAPYTPDTLRTPLYPLVIAFFYTLFGNLWATSLFQAFLNSLVPVLVALLTLKIYPSKRVAFLAGLFIALEPHFIIYGLSLSTEGIFIFLFTLTMFLFAKYLHNPSYNLAALAALLTGMTALTRPVFLYFAVIALFFIGWGVWRESKKKAFVSGLLFLVVVGAFVLPWSYRNYTVSGAFSFSSIGWVNVYTRTAATIDAMVNKNDFWTSYLRFLGKLKDEGYITKLEEGELYDTKFNSLLKERSLEIIKAHPKEFVLLQLLSTQAILTQDNMLYFLTHTELVPVPVRPPIPLSLSITQKGPVRAIYDLVPYLKGSYVIALVTRPVWILFFFFALVGAWFLIKTRRGPERKIVLLLVAIICYFVVMTLPVASSIDARYRVGFESVYFIFVATGLVICLERLGLKRIITLFTLKSG